jgi:predicted HTH domain antitoxin
MSKQSITLDFPNDVFLVLNESKNDLKHRLKIILAIQLYNGQKLSIGKAAQLSGLSRLKFEEELSKNKISISNLTEQDVMDDVEKLK